MQFNMERVLKKLRIKNKLIRELLAEFLGMYVIIIFGTASVAQYVLEPSKGTFLSINLAWGLAVAMAIYISGNVSGGHLNPAVTLALAIIGQFSWIKVIPYMIAQYLGSFVAAATTYWVYYDAMEHYGVFAVPDTAGIFATYPGGIWLSTAVAVSDQIVCTGLMMMMILAITDPRNMEVSKGYMPLVIGLLIALIGMCFGVNCGYAINPARDLSPRLVTLVAGWGTEVFTYANHYWWIPIVGPHIGAIVGSWTYLLFIGLHWEPLEDEVDEKGIKLETRF